MPDHAPVQITRFESRLVLTYKDGGGSAGLILSEPLSRILKKHSVTMAASLGPPKPRSGLSLGSSCTLDDMRIRPLRIIVYGLRSEGDTIADVLGDAGLFLQRPEPFEYDKRVKYFNPMYLLRPGEEMPKIVGGSTRGSTGGQAADSIDAEPLGEVERSQVLRIFNEAVTPHAVGALEIKQSPRLVSLLKE
jgi:SWI/SNF-related matrix-associated actin-dependent regulator of chromatin subfamily A3